MTEIKVVTVGMGGVGKSSFIQSLLTGKFYDDYDPTIEDNYRMQCIVEGKVHVLDILDTAGQEDLSAMQGEWFRSGEGFVILYAINERKSFEEALKLRDRIRQIKDTEYLPIVVCGNKLDLELDREVTTEEGRLLAQQTKSPFFEISAKKHVHINEVMTALVTEVHRYRREGKKQQQRNNNTGNQKKEKTKQLSARKRKKLEKACTLF